MKTRGILLVAVCAFFALTASVMAEPLTAKPLTAEEQNFQQAFETFRAKYGLELQMLDESLVAGSRNWSLRMRQTGSFQHGAAMENIYRGSASGVAAFRAWERSPAHRSLLLSPNIGAFGIGNDGNLWTFRARTRVVERAESVPRVVSPVIVQSFTPRVAVRQPLVLRGSLLKRHCCR